MKMFLPPNAAYPNIRFILQMSLKTDPIQSKLLWKFFYVETTCFSQTKIVSKYVYPCKKWHVKRKKSEEEKREQFIM